MNAINQKVGKGVIDKFSSHVMWMRHISNNDPNCKNFATLGSIVKALNDVLCSFEVNSSREKEGYKTPTGAT